MSLWTFFLLFLTAVAVAGKTVQVPAVVSDETIWLRLQQLLSLDRVFAPFGDLNRIYRKEVYEIVDGKEVAFPACYEEEPEAVFWATNQMLIGGDGKGFNSKGQEVVFDFQRVKYPRNLLDVAWHNNRIFFVREDGFIKTVEIEKKSFDLAKVRQFKTAQSKISKGSFVILPNATNGVLKGYGLFINQNQAVLFDLAGENFIQINGSNVMPNFETALPIQDRYFAVAYGQGGLIIYSIDFTSNSLKVEASFNQLTLNTNINVRDVTYDPVRQILFVLDHNTGVLPLQLTIGGGQLKAKTTSSTIKNSNCNLIYYDGFSEDLYLNCRELHKYRINNWPLLDEKVLPRQEISIREITSAGGVVGLIGRSVFEVIANQRRVAIYEDKYMDKFLIKQGSFISGNENYLLIGNFDINPPTVTCQTASKALVGAHKLVFKVVAECSQAYFGRTGFQPGVVTNQDKCVYTAYQTVSVWEPTEVNVKAFGIILIAIGVIGLGILVWWGFSSLKLTRMKNYLSHYHSLEEEHRQGQGGAKKADMMVEMSPVQQGGSEQKANVALAEEVQAGSKSLHDIE